MILCTLFTLIVVLFCRQNWPRADEGLQTRRLTPLCFGQLPLMPPVPRRLVTACVISTSAAKKYVGFRNDDVGFRLEDAFKAVSQVHFKNGVLAKLINRAMACAVQ